jgi:glycine betaine/proline transport system substrate-binding protein
VNCQKTTKGDVFLDAWLPSHKDYWADYGENLVVIGEAFSDATTGLPTYVTINSIEELNANKDKFKVKLLVLVVRCFIATRLKQ